MSTSRAEKGNDDSILIKTKLCLAMSRGEPWSPDTDECKPSGVIYESLDNFDVRDSKKT
jgi:hypothetical protein